MAAQASKYFRASCRFRQIVWSTDFEHLRKQHTEDRKLRHTTGITLTSLYERCREYYSGRSIPSGAMQFLTFCVEHLARTEASVTFLDLVKEFVA